jgi:hypothetical protein
MGLNNLSLLAGATVQASGGSALALTSDGQTVTNGLHLIVPADADYQTRRNATVKFRPPTLDPKTNVYGKDKKSITFVKPMVTAAGRVVFNTIRLEREVHPELSAAEAAELCKIGAQLLSDDDVAAFWATGSLV